MTYPCIEKERRKKQKTKQERKNERKKKETRKRERERDRQTDRQRQTERCSAETEGGQARGPTLIHTYTQTPVVHSRNRESPR